MLTEVVPVNPITILVDEDEDELAPSNLPEHSLLANHPFIPSVNQVLARAEYDEALAALNKHHATHVDAGMKIVGHPGIDERFVYAFMTT